MTSPARPIFIVGCQRSGTTLLAKVLARSPQVRVYHESDPEAFEKFRLRGDDTIHGLLAAGGGPFAVFKPICDSHSTDRLLKAYPDARVIWIYRDYRDVAASAVAKWGEHQAKVMQQIRAGTWERETWRTERLDAEDLAALREVQADPLTPESGAALFWWLRNRFYFKLGLAREPRVLLLRYENLVRQPPQELARLEGFLGLAITPDMAALIHGESVSKGRAIAVEPEVAALCEKFQAELGREG